MSVEHHPLRAVHRPQGGGVEGALLSGGAPSEARLPGAGRAEWEAGMACPFLCGRVSLPEGTCFLKKEEEGLEKKK